MRMTPGPLATRAHIRDGQQLQGRPATPSTHAEASSSSSGSGSLASRVGWELLLLASAAAPAWPAWAEDGVAYNPEGGEGLVKSLSGAAYIALLMYFLFRVFNRRARKAREERISGQGPVTTVFTQIIEKATEGKPRPKATPLNALIGGLQAGVIGYGLFVFTSKVEASIAMQELPSGYTAQNIAITVRTIIIGLLYLATFIFSANALGLTALSVQLLLFPGSVPDEEELAASRQPKAPQLPKVTVTSSTDEIRKAFQAVAKPASGSRVGGAGGRSSGVSQNGASSPSAAVGTSSSSDGGSS